MTESKKRLKVLCLHGFRNNGEFLRAQINRWGSDITEKLHMTCPNAPYLAKGKSDIEGLSPPPYFEWLPYVPGVFEYENLGKTFNFVEEFMEKKGPFDGMLGFSQGGAVSVAIIGFQRKGVMLKNHPPIRFLIAISAAKFANAEHNFLYTPRIECKSVHIIGENDQMRRQSEELIECFESPLVIYHPGGHVIPRLDINGKRVLKIFLEDLQPSEAAPETVQSHINSSKL